MYLPELLLERFDLALLLVELVVQLRDFVLQLLNLGLSFATKFRVVHLQLDVLQALLLIDRQRFHLLCQLLYTIEVVLVQFLKPIVEVLQLDDFLLQICLFLFALALLLQQLLIELRILLLERFKFALDFLSLALVCAILLDLEFRDFLLLLLDLDLGVPEFLNEGEG